MTILFGSLIAKAGTPSPNLETSVTIIQSIEKVDMVMTVEETSSDTLYLKDGRVFPITYMSQTGMSIKFKKLDDPINRTWRKEKSKIQKIVYADGRVDSFSQISSDGNRSADSNSMSGSEKTSAALGAVVGSVIIGAIVSGVVVVWMILNAF